MDHDKNIVKPPRVDVERRREVDRLAEERYISPQLREERVKAAMTMKGVDNMNQLRHTLGMDQQGLKKALQGRRPTLSFILRLAVALDVTIRYLTVKDLKDERV